MPFSFSFPMMLWLLPLAAALLVLFRLLRARRRVILAGSLLIWNRVAAMPVTTRPKRIVFDLSLVLQALAIAMLVLALAKLFFVSNESESRTIVLLLDNGPSSRLRSADGKPLLDAGIAKARSILNDLGPSDRVLVARSSPTPAVLNIQPADPKSAAAMLDKITPALSGPDQAAIWLFATDRVRAESEARPAQAVIVSFQSAPLEGDSGNRAALWLNVADPHARSKNVGLVAAGSLKLDDKNERRISVRVANFAAENANGNVVLETLDGKKLAGNPVVIDGGAQSTLGFSVPSAVTVALRVSWKSADSAEDALPEDDSIVFTPQPVRAPRIQFNSPQPALEKLFKRTMDAQASEQDKEVDLAVYVGSVPERIPAGARAALFVAPEQGYRSYFDISDKAVKVQSVEAGDPDPLNAGITQSPVSIPKVLEVLRTGDFKTLLRDHSSGRALAIKFVDEKSRPCYALAFSPGDGLPPERFLEPPLAALLTRMALEASRSGPPYALEKASASEASSNSSLPLDWRPGATQSAGGVLDERASQLSTHATAPVAGVKEFLFAQGGGSKNSFDPASWLIVLGLLIAAVEFFKSRE